MTLLVYGQSGCGKTTFWSTFPAPILVVVCSGSFKPGELKSVDTPENKERIFQVVLQHSSEIREILNHVKQSGRYKTIVLDHVSGLQDLTLKEITGLKELPAQMFWGAINRDQYAQSTAQCKEYCRAMLNLSDNHNVVIVGQERTFKGKDDEEVGDSDIVQMAIGVGVTPALAAWLQPAVDYTVQAFKRPRYENVETVVNKKKSITRQRVRGVDFCIRTEAHDLIATKFRLPLGWKLPDVIPNPTYDKIMAVIRGEYIEE